MTMNSPSPTPSIAELRKFGGVMAATIAALFGVLLPWLFDRAWPLWPWIVAGVFAISAWLSPAWLAPVRRGWMAVGGALGWINTRILLAVVFYLIMLPVGLAMRLAGRISTRPANSTADSFRRASTERSAKDMERPF